MRFNQEFASVSSDLQQTYYAIARVDISLKYTVKRYVNHISFYVL